MILITGANGHLGQQTIDFLLAKGMQASHIAALVRDASKSEGLKSKGVQVRIGSYDDKASLAAAMEGNERVLLVSGTDLMNRMQQHFNVVDAAKAAGVKHLLYTSFVRKDDNVSVLGPVAQSHIETDRYIKASGIPYTLLLNGLYSESLAMFLGDKVLEQGIYMPAGDGKAGYTSRTDLAEATANILLSAGHENQSYVLANPERISLHELAAQLTVKAGKPVGYFSPSPEAYVETLSKAGVAADMAGFLASFGTAIAEGEFDPRHTDLEALLGRKATPLIEVLKPIYFSAQ